LCGLGQLYNGQIAKGLVLIALGVVAVVSWQLLLGKTLALIVWTYAVVDAYLVARRTRILHLSQGPYVPHNA
jgi:TM2 domain-containing membrane protein YozV